MKNNIIRFYVKTHRTTGLKYFGKTVKNISSYWGSGKYWLNHIKTHGYDVNTEIVGEFDNIEEAMNFGLKFSEENNIVESKEWANLVPENGIGGGSFPGRVFSEDHKRNIAASLKGKPKPWLRHKRPKEVSEKISISNKGKNKSKEHCENISKARKGKALSEDHRINSAKAHEKTWLLIDPQGNEYIVTGLTEFCEENALNRGHIGSVARGERKQHKGWICKRKDDK